MHLVLGFLFGKRKAFKQSAVQKYHCNMLIINSAPRPMSSSIPAATNGHPARLSNQKPIPKYARPPSYNVCVTGRLYPTISVQQGNQKYKKLLLELPVLSLPAFIHKIEASSNKQRHTERTRSPAVIVASSLAVANRPTSIEVDAHRVKKTTNGQKGEDTGDPESSRCRVVPKVEERRGNGSDVNRVLKLQ